MKIFSWMLNKRNAKKPIDQEPLSYHTTNQSCNEEYSDWPDGLLAIGTFGNSNNLKHSDINQDHDQENTTSEDFVEVHDDDKEMRLLLNKHISLDSNKHCDLTAVEKLLDCLREDHDEKKTSNVLENKCTHLQRSTSVVHKGGNDHIRPNNKKSSISKKSLSFLIKKAFLCRGGFVSTPILRDPLQDPKLDNSRMEKILRAMLHKKIYPQKQSPKSSSKKYLDMPQSDSDEDEYEEGGRQSKWVKTDSEYIVLEI